MKRILIVVDMQNDFIFRDYALGTEQAEAAYKNLMDWLGTMTRDAFDYIIFTRDTHFKYYLSTAEGLKLPIAHCLNQSPGWQVPNDLIKTAEILLEDKGILPTYIDKYTFGSINLPDVLATLVKEEDDRNCIFEFCGLCTDICVVSNVLMTKAFFPEANIVVHEKFCAGVTPESHDAAITTMKSCQIEVI